MNTLPTSKPVSGVEQPVCADCAAGSLNIQYVALHRTLNPFNRLPLLDLRSRNFGVRELGLYVAFYTSV